MPGFGADVFPAVLTASQGGGGVFVPGSAVRPSGVPLRLPSGPCGVAVFDPASVLARSGHSLRLAAHGSVLRVVGAGQVFDCGPDDDCRATPDNKADPENEFHGLTSRVLGVGIG